MEVNSLVVSMFATNCYIVSCPDTNEAVIIDPGAEGKSIISTICSLGVKVKYIINTHAHVDHVGANGMLKNEYSVPIMINKKDLELYQNPGFGLKLFLKKQPMPEQFIGEGDEVLFGNQVLKVFETPGHSEGGVCLYGSSLVFCGDTLFAGSIGRTNLPGGSYDKLIRSIKSKLLTLPPDTKVYPGHGSFTTIETEVKANPFLK
ncbi:MAG: MBL fold metallo-hydrolase [Bacillota bacterium]